LGVRRLQAAENENQVVISCTGWRNPVAPSVVNGFKIRTYDQHMDHVIDSSNLLSIDASALEAEAHQTEFSTTNEFTGQVTDLTFTVMSPVAIRDGCFVLLTIPVEYDVSQVDPTTDITLNGQV
jgi:hypothetical protein